ncbi:MAG TPA: hypothetical protein DIS79_07385 [Bacteroidetes bacterium]|nr:hypothetical protein [Bacteroidota bacterium]HRK03537.1 alpha/beta fold hydrolase [Chlorobiota bacterium]
MDSPATNIRAVSSPTKHWRIFLFSVAALVGIACQRHEPIVGPSPSNKVLVTPYVDDSLRHEFTVESLDGLLHGVVVRQPDTIEATGRIVVVLHHGGQGSMADYHDHVELLYDAGFDVVAWDYRGTGRSTGKLTETVLTVDVHNLITVLRRDHYTDDTRFVAYGISVGSVAALLQATTDSTTWGVILESPIASADHLIQSSSTLDVVAEWRNGGTYDNVTRIRQLRSPLLILAGNADRAAPLRDHASVLHQEAALPKMLVTVSGAGHTDVISTLGRDVFIDMLLAHLRR